MESACSGDGPYRKIEIEEADGSSSGQKSTNSLSLFLETSGFEVEEERSTMATQTRAEEAWFGKWHTEQEEAWLNQVFVETSGRTCKSGDVRLEISASSAHIGTF